MKYKVIHIIKDTLYSVKVYNQFKKVRQFESHFFYLGDASQSHFIGGLSSFNNFHQVDSLDLLYSDRSYFIDAHIVVLHHFDVKYTSFLRYLRKNNPDLLVSWIGYGTDYDCWFSNDLLMPLTKKNSYPSYFHRVLKQSRLKRWIKSLKVSYRKKKIFTQVNYISTVLPNEFDRLNLKPLFQTKYIPYMHGELRRDFALSEEFVSGSAILIGNSAYPKNNHFDILKKLKKKWISDSNKLDIIIPLSYGDMPYANMLKRYIANDSDLVDRVQFLEKFIPLEDYTNILLECRNVIMPHKVQTGLGNILASLYYGARVYLHKDNPIHEYLNALGVTSFVLEDINHESFFKDLPKSIQIHNRNIIQEYWGELAYKKSFDTYIGTLLDELQSKNLESK